MQETDYTIHLPVYEGPLDLLLELIQNAELEITRVSLAQVTDQYLEYMRNIPDRHISDLASFLVIAARLLQIKSEALLPRPPVREPGEEDPGDALARQLLAYKKYKEVAQLLGERDKAGLRTYIRLAPPPTVEPKLDMQDTQVEDLLQAFIEAFSTRHDGPALETVVAAPKIRIREKIDQIVASIRESGRANFYSLLKTAHSRLEIVVSFLAILELIKQNQIRIQQDRPFSDIEIYPGERWDQDQPMEFDLEFEE